MKADFCGTLTEQRRYSLGWVAPTRRPRCGNCKHHEIVFSNSDSLAESSSIKCGKIDGTTLKQAICKEWEQR